MVKVNGWQRIGIIASVVWILGAWVHTYDSEINSASELIVSTHVACDSNLAGITGDAWKKGFDECNKQDNESRTQAMAGARLDAEIVAFVPVPLGWGFAYLVLFLVRWVKRGFMRPV
jgi:hypothetical protein